MNRSSKLALLACALGAASPACADADSVRKAIAENLPDVPIRSIVKAPYGNLYEVVINGTQIMYTDEKAQVGIFGKTIDLRTRTDLTEKRVQELMTLDFASLPLEKSIVKVRGDGSRKLAVFSDPDCPYCRQLEKELARIDNVTIYTFLYPLESLHPGATRKAEAIWCSADRAQAYDALMLEDREPAAAGGCSTPVQEIAELAQKHWITGTPGLVFASGRIVAGVLQRHQIEALLDSTQQPLAASR